MEQWKEVRARGHTETIPQPLMQFLDCPKRVRVTFGGEVLVDTSRALLLRERGHVPVYYFPRDDVRMERLAPTTHHTR